MSTESWWNASEEGDEEFWSPSLPEEECSTGNMDALTPKGLRALEAAREAVKAVESLGKWRVTVLREHDASTLDLLLTDAHREGELDFAEVKCRWMSSRQFDEDFHGKWLISYAKLHRAYGMTRCNHIPTVGVLYCMVDGVVLVQRFWDRSGKLLVDRIELKNSWTQATVKIGRAHV